MDNRFREFIVGITGAWRELPKSTPYHSLVYGPELSENINAIVDYFKNSSFLKLDNDFTWGIVPEIDINAVAFKSDHTESVGMFYGLLSLIFHYYSVLGCCSDFLPELKSNRKFDSENPISGIDAEELKLQFQNIRKMKGRIGLAEHQKIPLDAGRFEYMADCGLYSCIFVFLHEIGHVIRGHTDLCEASDEGRKLLYEFGDSCNRIESKSLEIDADRFAAYIYSKYFLETAAKWENDKHRYFRKAWLSILLFFLLLDIRMGSKRSSSHPAPAHRYAIVKKSILNSLSNEGYKHYKKLHKSIETLEFDLKNFFDEYNFLNICFYSDLQDHTQLQKLEYNYRQTVPLLNKCFETRLRSMGS